MWQKKRIKENQRVLDTRKKTLKKKKEIFSSQRLQFSNLGFFLEHLLHTFLTLATTHINPLTLTSIKHTKKPLIPLPCSQPKPFKHLYPLIFPPPYFTQHHKKPSNTSYTTHILLSIIRQT